MTRREEIVKATKDCRKDYVGLGRHITSDDIADAFEEGAYWADKTMIEKATQWLFENVYDYLNPEDQERVESFRKAMKE